VTSTLSALPLARLLQLASPALPVGAYSYSQGLEGACESGTVSDAASAERWIGDALSFGLARMEAPVWCRLHTAWCDGDGAAVAHWNRWFIATRETAELRAETLQMGWSLTQLLADLGEFDAPALLRLHALHEPAFPAAWTFAAAQWQISAHDALVAYLWAWLENQVMAVVKALPLGQTDGQRMLARLGRRLPGIAAASMAASDCMLANFTPALAIACSRHETQYSRLFRS
jgi:urease accessory protein